GVFSKYSTKSIMGGEGGVIVSTNPELQDFLDRYSKYDRSKRELLVGLNTRISEISALFLYSLCKEAHNIFANKKATIDQYKAACDKVGLQYIDEKALSCTSNYYKFAIICPDEDRRAMGMKNKTSQ